MFTEARLYEGATLEEEFVELVAREKRANATLNDSWMPCKQRRSCASIRFQQKSTDFTSPSKPTC